MPVTSTSPAFVAGFDDKQGRPDPAEDLAVLSGSGLGKESTVVDLGMGTGQFALRAARVFGKVIAVDISPAMLEVLRNRASELGLDNLDCIEAGFLSYEHAGPPADAVYTRNALHQLPDFWKALALTRIAAFLRAGGVLRLHDLIYDFQPSQAEAVFTRWLGHAATDPNRGYTARTSPSTSAPSTAPFAGCSSRCSALPGLRSRPRTSTDRCTEPTPASRPEAVETIGSPRREKIPSACSWS